LLLSVNQRQHRFRYSLTYGSTHQPLNYLAHLYLAQPTARSRLGNLLGDFAKGLDTSRLHPEIYAGLLNHRAVDHFTDQHPIVTDLKRRFSPQRRRFAGITLDVLFDHFLIQHWAQLCSPGFDQFLASTYCDLTNLQNDMPAPMQRTVMRMVEQDWIRSYNNLEQVGFALDRIASRIRFKHRFDGVIEEVYPLYPELEKGFLLFFPDLQQHISDIKLEIRRS